MKIAVLIKQVPETGDVKMDEQTGTMVRESSNTIVNPLDLYAVETAIRLRREPGGETVAFSMGPAKAVQVLREAIAMGCDRGILLTDRGFAGADTLATSYVLSRALQKEGGFDLIICGERATDGETGQVGPGVAGLLDLPVVTFVSNILSCDGHLMEAERLVEGGYEHIEVRLPAVLTVVKQIGEPRLPNLTGKKRAKQVHIPFWGSQEINADPDCLGLQGSPTRVVKIFHPKVTRQGRKIFAKDDVAVDQAVDELLDFLEARNVI